MAISYSVNSQVRDCDKTCLGFAIISAIYISHHGDDYFSALYPSHGIPFNFSNFLSMGTLGALFTGFAPVYKEVEDNGDNGNLEAPDPDEDEEDDEFEEDEEEEFPEELGNEEEDEEEDEFKHDKDEYNGNGNGSGSAEEDDEDLDEDEFGNEFEEEEGDDDFEEEDEDDDDEDFDLDEDDDDGDEDEYDPGEDRLIAPTAPPHGNFATARLIIGVDRSKLAVKSAGDNTPHYLGSIDLDFT